ncbi:MAG: hypothetical protein R2713_10570 [Ilumatobacteraceae bacterium]
MTDLFAEAGSRCCCRHVTEVAPGMVHYEQIDGTVDSLAFDFAMLLPPFRGVRLPCTTGPAPTSVTACSRRPGS